MASELEKIILLGKNIQKARKDKGLSQNAFAGILNISREHVAKIETAKRKLSLSLLFKISEALDISESELFNFKK